MNQFPFNTPVSIQSVSSLYPQVAAMDVLRLDQIHPVISGNKWYKLQYYLALAVRNNYPGIVTWGGAWSNHIVATAAAAALLKLPCVGIIRGEEPKLLSATLQSARAYGMQLHFVSREDYDAGKLPPQLAESPYLHIPAGGEGPLGVKGAAHILDNINPGYTHILCAVGTGTMLAGLSHALHSHQKLVGISVLKGHEEVDNVVQRYGKNVSENVTINRDYHFGGYARYNEELIHFMNTWHTLTEIPSDFVYTGKLFYAADTLVLQSYFQPQDRLLIIHSGGLQGNQSLEPQQLIF